MQKKLLLSFLLFVTVGTYAQLGAMKMVGKNTDKYSLGYSAYIKLAMSVSPKAQITFELEGNYFQLNDGGDGSGTFQLPLKAGYRYFFTRDDETGFYAEPQAGYNLYGITSLLVDSRNVDLKYHGVVLAAGTGYVFGITENLHLDLNLRYETIMADGGSNNYFSLGFSIPILFKKK